MDILGNHYIKYKPFHSTKHIDNRITNLIIPSSNTQKTAQVRIGHVTLRISFK